MNKRLVIRADDVGYTHVYDLGIYQAIENGIVTSADVMLDSPHTVESLKWLKQRPWISIGWHRHLWETPVLPPNEIPSLVDEEGRFAWGHKKDYLKKVATYEDCYKELCAELDRCIDIYGSAPKYTSFWDDGTQLERAMIDVCKLYEIDYNFWSETVIMPPFDFKNRRNMFDLAQFSSYDPAKDLIGTTWKNDEDIMCGVGHPGYLDYHIFKESSCSIHRLKELDMMLDPRVFKWIKDNNIELINADDARNGTHIYQDYLKSINSPLYINK